MQCSFYEITWWWKANYHRKNDWIRKLVVQGLSASDVAAKLRGQGDFQLKDVKRAVIEQKWSINCPCGDENLNIRSLRMEWFNRNFGNNWKKRELVLPFGVEKEGYDNVLDIFIAEYDRQDQCCDLIEKGMDEPVQSFL